VDDPIEAGPGSLAQGWEDRAASWLAWARTPGFDAYWAYRDFFFEEMVPPPGAATLEIGCGEGRVSRDLVGRRHDLTAIDPSPSLLAAAAALDQRSRYLVASAEQLPFADGTFDLVVAYNVLMDVADMPRALAEAARVMTDGGHLSACVTHPLSDAGDFAGSGPDASFEIQGAYLGKRWVSAHLERGGLEMEFDGWAFDLESYSRALEACGLGFEKIREPRPRGGGDPRRDRIPNFLMFSAVRHGPRDGRRAGYSR
jgi:SAM-dependent methyltransferase